MTLSDLLTSAELVFAALIAALTFTVGALLIQTAKLKARADRQLQRTEDLQEMLAACSQTLIALGSTFDGIENRISQFTDRNLEIQSQLAIHRSFEEASRLIREGGTAESLVESCGLSDAEADLMVRLHQQTQPAPRRHLKQAPVGGVSNESDRTSGGASDRNSDQSGTVNKTGPNQRLGEEPPPPEGEIRLREALRAAQFR